MANSGSTPRKRQSTRSGENEASRAVSGAPEPQKVAKALAPETTTGPTPNGEPENNPDATAANGVEPERNGAPTEVGTARAEDGPTNPPEADGVNAPRTAAHPVVEQEGDAAERSGLALDMRENDTVRGEKPGEGILLNGARSEIGTGTDTPEENAPELPEYPSSTLVRKTPRSAPLEPADIRNSVKPEIGYDLASTDATAAAAGLRSHAGENLARLLDKDGNEVAASDIFESLESNPYVRQVKQDVVEEFTVNRQKTPLTRLLFVKGQQVPAATAEAFVSQHG